MAEETVTVSLRGEGHPLYEKLVWQGESDALPVGMRIRIVRETEDSELLTVIERFALAADGVERWIEQDRWEKPERSHPWSYFAEAFIDLLGRPEWDTRAKVTSTYPLWLKVGKEW